MTIGPLVDAAWLTEHLHHSPLRLVDCRWSLADVNAGRAAYEEGHIPGAVYVSLDDDLSAIPGRGRHPLPSRETFARTLGSLGIGPRNVVVAYDDKTGAIAARLWWMMRWMGHRHVAVLEGGIAGWLAAGGSLSSDAKTHDPTTYEPATETMPTVDREELLERLDRATVIDARAEERYRGDTEPVDPVAGHIAGALNAPHVGNVDAAGAFLSPDVLLERYTALGAHGDDTVVYCGSGVTACHDILAMEVAGLPTATLYPGSWSDWLTDPGTPKAVG